MDNTYTHTAQKLLETCKQACQLDEYRDQMQNLEEQINLALQKQLNENDRMENCQIQNSPRMNLDPSADNNEMNLTPINESIDEALIHSSTSNQSAMSFSKKLKTSSSTNKKSTNNSNNINYSKLKSVSSSSNLQAKKNKRNLLSMGEIIRNSPKSSSDIEVFVDVESLDDRTNNGSNFLNSNRIASDFNQMTNESIHFNDNYDLDQV